MMLVTKLLWGGLLAAMIAAPLHADPHRFTAGDEITLGLVGQAGTTSARVDRDGWLRLPGLAQVALRGLTIEEGRAAVTRALVADAGLRDPQVIISIDRYAPITVGGDVLRAGLVDYAPDMTAGMAYAMAGGARAEAAGTVQDTLTYLESRAALALIAQEQDHAVQRIILFATLLDHTIPADAAPTQNTQTQIGHYRETLAKAQSQWADQIDQIATLIAGLEQRVILQDQIIVSRQGAAEIAQNLVDRQLRTAATAESAELLLLDARARRLDLVRLISEAQLQATALRREQQAQYDAVRLDWSERLHIARRDHDRAALQHAAGEPRLEYLSQIVGNPGSDGEGQVVYHISRYGPDGVVVIEGRRGTEVLPGDAIIIRQAPPQDLHSDFRNLD